MKKTKVCIISGYRPAMGRGAEQIYNLLEELRQYDQLEVTLLANMVPGAPPIERGEGLTVMRVWRPNSWISLFRIVARVIRIRPAILHISHPHLYYGRSVYTAIFISFLMSAARVLRIKRLVWMEHVYPLDKINGSTLESYQYHGSPRLLRYGLLFYTRLIGTLATLVLVQTEADQQALRQSYKIRNSGCLVIGMKGASIDKGRAKQHLGLDNKKVLLVFGFISQFKGIEYAIKAFADVHKRCPDSALLIAGSIHPRIAEAGFSSESLKLLARHMQIDNAVVFKDTYIPPAEHPVYYSAADIVLLPYLTSLGPSSVMMEAYQYGVPVIASDVDFIREDIQHEKTGLLVPPGDSDALARATMRLLSDDELYRSIRENIKGVAGKYSIEEVAGKLKDLYLSL